ncbi:MAG: hypothetical protein KBT34_04375 [Prevotella sp.]|nr:hypothetical protein [Candidatus Prevotella equi]
MKKILSFFVALVCYVSMSFAQTSFVATLSHEGNFTHYYGAGAFTSAYNASVNGDIITLSPGTFTFSGSFNKGITVRGAGIDASEKTYISSEMKFYSTDETMTTTIEGIVFSSSYTYVYNDASGNGQGTLKFIKNRFGEIHAVASNTYSNDRGPIVRMYNDIITSSMYFSNTNCHPDFLFYNCYVANPRCYGYNSNSGFISIGENTSAFVNCVINWTNTYCSENYYLNYYNCIFNWTYSSYGGSNLNYSLPSTASCFNCLSINKSYLFAYLVSKGNNSTTSSVTDVFKTYTNGFNYGETFELADDAKEKYIGTDGTPIGMQGGKYPYTSTVQYPIITKFTSEPNTTKEGKLTIDVEVDGK